VLLLRVEPAQAGEDKLRVNFNLTAREVEVLSWIAKGKTNRDIAEILGMSHRTVNKHLEHIYTKLGVETRTAAAAFAMSHLSAS
jgi:DNA-binding CsgD family transcriptional regulator